MSRILKKVTSSRKPAVTINNGTTFQKVPSRIQALEQDFIKLRDDIAELILLESKIEPAAVSVFDLTFDEYMELPGNVRL